MSFASTTKMIQPFCTVHHAHCIPSKHDSLWFPYTFYDSINAKFFALCLSLSWYSALCECVSVCVCRQFHRHTISNGTHFKPHFSGGITFEHTFRSSCRASNKHVCIKHAVSSRIGSKYMFLFLYIWGTTFSILFLCASTFTVILRYIFVILLLLIFYSHIRFAQFCVFYFIPFHFIQG